MDIRFPHPKSQLTVDQINNQIKANTRKKKKKCYLTDGLNDNGNDVQDRNNQI